MTEGLWGEPQVFVPDKARVGVVFDVVAADEVLEVVERLVRAVGHLDHAHLHYVHLLEAGHDMVRDVHIAVTRYIQSKSAVFGRFCLAHEHQHRIGRMDITG